MSHHGGGRFDGSRGSLRTMRDEEKRQKKRRDRINSESAAVAERAARGAVLQAASEHTLTAVSRIAELMQSDNHFIALAASREMLRLVNAYPTKAEIAGAPKPSAGDVKVVVMAYNGNLPAAVATVPVLAPQSQLGDAPAPAALEADFDNVSEPRATH